MDGEIDPVIRRDLGGYLRKFSSTYGTYAITGNHEYIGGVERACAYLREHSITLLQDEVAEVGGIIIAGQDDLSSARFGRHRSTLSDLLADVDKKNPLSSSTITQKTLRGRKKWCGYTVLWAYAQWSALATQPHPEASL